MSLELQAFHLLLLRSLSVNFISCRSTPHRNPRNDDLVQGERGFGEHPPLVWHFEGLASIPRQKGVGRRDLPRNMRHRDMEIMTLSS